MYGGALEVGSASLPFFDATNLVHKNKADGLPAVIVSFEYRVNVFVSLELNGPLSAALIRMSDCTGLC